MNNSGAHTRKLAIATLVSLLLSGSAHALASPEMTKVRNTNNWAQIKQKAEQLLKQDSSNVYARECLVEANIQRREFTEARKNLAMLNGVILPGKFNYLGALIELYTGNPSAARMYADRLGPADLKVPTIRNLNEQIYSQCDKTAWMNTVIKHRGFAHANWYLSGGRTGDHANASAELMQIVSGPDGVERPYQFASMLLSKVPPSALNVDEKVLLARSMVEQNKFAEAVTLCEDTGIQRAEKTLEVLHCIAGAGKGMPPKALAVLESIKPQMQDSTKFWDTISFAYMANGKNDKAHEAAKTAMQLAPSAERLWMRYQVEAGNVAAGYRTKSIADQMTTLEQIIQKFPSEKAYQERAKLWHDLGVFDKELEDLARLVSMAPAGPRRTAHLVRKADVEYSIGDLRAAMETVAQALAADPENEHCLFLKDRMQFEMKRANIK
jgi:tetratricopeptide (TPR) repeat protein